MDSSCPCMANRERKVENMCRSLAVVRGLIHVSSLLITQGFMVYMALLLSRSQSVLLQGTADSCAIPPAALFPFAPQWRQ